MGTVFFVHCVDTEGPLHESLEATFEDAARTFGIELEPTTSNLEKLQDGSAAPERVKAAVMARYGKARLNYNRDWSMIDRMHDTLFSRAFRDSIIDDFGRPYVLSWFCLDHVGFEENPRRRPLGFHVVFDYYESLTRRSPDFGDGLYWHFHPVAFNRRANCQGLTIQNSNLHLQSLSRRLLDREHFSAAFRPGYHQEKTDINLFLEQWIPFDYANLNCDDHQGRRRADYRFIDWRDAPTSWTPYHPSFAEAGRPGDLKRWIARTLTLSTNFCAITEAELVKAFQAAATDDVLVSVCGHDNRDMVAEIRELWSLIQSARRRAGTTAKLAFATATEGYVGALGLPATDPLRLTLSLEGNEALVRVNGEMFNSQPFFCFRTAGGEYWHDNLSRGEDRSFFYVFDEHSVPLRGIDRIGVAATSPRGDVTLELSEPATGKRWSRVLPACHSSFLQQGTRP